MCHQDLLKSLVLNDGGENARIISKQCHQKLVLGIDLVVVEKKNSFGAVITIKTSRNMDKYVIKTCQMVLFLLILIWWRWKKGPFDAVMIILHLAD